MADIQPNLKSKFSKIWQFSLLSFILAASTGVLYRYGMLYPLPEWIGLTNIRHAHSHLMFFNWVTPPIMALMMVKVVGKGDNRSIRQFSLCLYTMIGLGFLSWPFFLLYGYQPVSVGPASLPIAAILSGLIMVTWYWFAALYYKKRKDVKESVTVTLFDAALIALLVSSLGAWGVSVFQFSDIESPLISSAMTHFFLGVFTEGWVVLGVLGVVWQKAGIPEINHDKGWLWLPLLFGSMLVFPFSLNRAIITPAMHVTANVGLILIAISLTVHLWLFIKYKRLRGFVWKTVLSLLALKVLFQIGAVLPVDIWPGEHGLRILYLHILLLGVASVALIGAFVTDRLALYKKIFAITVLLILVSLAAISGYWPSALLPSNIYRWVMIIAVLPIIPVIRFWADGFRTRKGY